MRTERGNLWNFLNVSDSKIVVPTNIGWDRFGKNVMGRGVAREAAELNPDLPNWYGKHCQELREYTGVLVTPDGIMILFPTKKLNPKAPHLSWKNLSTIDLIEKGLKELTEIPGRIYLPALGCGNGGLRLSEVRPLMEKYLTDDRFVLVLPSA